MPPTVEYLSILLEYAIDMKETPEMMPPAKTSRYEGSGGDG